MSRRKSAKGRGGDESGLFATGSGFYVSPSGQLLTNNHVVAECREVRVSEGEKSTPLTLIATATRPLGGESTLIALDVALTSTGRLPALDLLSSGAVKPELLVGEDGAEAITKARAAAIEARR